MQLEDMAGKVNLATKYFVGWLYQCDSPGIDQLIAGAFARVEADLSRLDGQETCKALQRELSEILKQIVRAELGELDEWGDDMNDSPASREALHPYLLGWAYIKVDYEAAAEQLLRLVGKWAPGEADGNLE